MTSYKNYSHSGKTVDYILDNDGKQITVKGTRIKLAKIGGTVELDLKITNYLRGGITGSVQNFKGGLRGRLARGRINEGLWNINPLVKNRIHRDLDPENSLWRASEFTISEGKFRFLFNKSNEPEELEIPKSLL